MREKFITSLLVMTLLLGSTPFISSSTALAEESEAVKKAQEQEREQAKKAAEEAKKIEEKAREAANKEVELAKEAAKKEAELIKKEWENQREAAKQELEQKREQTKTMLELYAKYSGLTGEERERIKTQLEAQVEEMKQEREKIFEEYKDKLEAQRELRKEQLESIREQRKNELEALKERRQELLKEKTEDLTEADKAERLANAERHAANINSRLGAAAARLVALAEKVQQQIDSLEDKELATKLNTDLASLLDEQKDVATKVATAQTALKNITNITGDESVLDTANDEVKAAVDALRNLRSALQEIASKL